MLASVLKSEIAALVSIRITNAFVAMRKALASIAPLSALADRGADLIREKSRLSVDVVTRCLPADLTPLRAICDTQ